MSSAADEGKRAPPALLPLCRTLGDLKRIRSAGRAGSIAERLFEAAWARIAAGEAPEAVARGTVRAALIATRLGDLDAGVLNQVGIPQPEVGRIQGAALAQAAMPLDMVTRAWLSGGTRPEAAVAAAPLPGFVARLAAQSRAGATHPERGRLVLEPPESHAEHCVLVAVIGALLAPSWEANSATVFVAGLAHHLHNALLPDSGFAGEMLLGEWLQPAFARATSLALQELDPMPRNRVAAALRVIPDAGTPEGRAFHAADTLDRVLQVEHHLRAAGTTMDFVLREMELVHAGPTRTFQDAVLVRFGLMAGPPEVRGGVAA
jgi:5'-deoxynucleotidase YfbR-like HD superfamily hydrolase